jgi:hypothetical protein
MMPIVDLSVGGALVQGEAVCPLGRRVRLILLLAHNRRILVQGHIVRVASNGHGPAFAVQFEAVSSEGLRSLSCAVSLELRHQLGTAPATAGRQP